MFCLIIQLNATIVKMSICDMLQLILLITQSIKCRLLDGHALLTFLFVSKVCKDSKFTQRVPTNCEHEY